MKHFDCNTTQMGAMDNKMNN